MTDPSEGPSEGPADQPAEESPISSVRQQGLEKMAEVYGWEVTDGDGDFFSITAEHLFGNIWQRPGMSTHDRRLLLIGMLIGSGQEDVLDIQLPAALGNGELDATELRDIVIFAAHYAGWPRGARLNNQVEAIIARHDKQLRKQTAANHPDDNQGNADD